MRATTEDFAFDTQVKKRMLAEDRGDVNHGLRGLVIVSAEEHTWNCKNSIIGYNWLVFSSSKEHSD